MNRPEVRRSVRRVVTESIAIFAAGSLGAGVLLHAVPARLARQIAPDAGDPMFVLYLLRWGARQIATGFPDFWHLNIFYPLADALGLSDHLIGPAAAFGLLSALGATPALAFNLLLLGSFGWAALSAFDVLRRLDYGWFASVVAGWTWAFSHLRWHSLSQLHVLLGSTAPWTIYAFDRLLVAPSGRRAAAFLFFYALNLSGGVYLGYGQHLALLAIVLLRAKWIGRHLLSRREAVLLLSTMGVAAALVFFAFEPYLRFRLDNGVTTPLAWVSPFRLTVMSWLTIGNRSALSDLVPAGLVGRTPLWMGLVPTVFLAIGAARLGRRQTECQRERPRSALQRTGLALGMLLIVAAIAVGDWATGRGPLIDERSAEPVLRLYRRMGWIALAGGILTLACVPERVRRFFGRSDPRPAFAATAMLAFFGSLPIGFFVLRNGLPGYGALRVTARIAALAVPFLLILVAEGADAVARWRRRTLALGLAVLAVLGLSWELRPKIRSVSWESVPSRPAEYSAATRWIAMHPEARVIVEIPFLLNWREARRMVDSTLHWKPLVNGYSSYIPPTTLWLGRFARELPQDGALAALARQGVTHVVVHYLDFPRSERKMVRQRWKEATESSGAILVRSVLETENTSIFELAEPGAAIGGEFR